MGRPLLDAERIRTCEAGLAAALPAGSLMQQAGSAAARLVIGRYAPRRALVVCGPGNNGGDGYVCARELHGAGVAVEVVALDEPTGNDARDARQSWMAAGGTILPALPAAIDADVAVDAMFGIGMRRALAGAYLAAAARLNALAAPVVAIDVPSGLDVDRGAWAGGVDGVHADLTITFIGDKPGLHTGVGPQACGEIVVEPLGEAPTGASGELLEPADFLPLLVARKRDTHKGTFGNAAIVGGDAGMVGAALLAARACLRFGAGRVYVCAIGAADLAFDPLQPELMFRPLDRLPAVDACVIGCGLGTAPHGVAALRRMLQESHSLVIDADALNLVAATPELRELLRQHAGSRVLTPHPLEAARLLGISVAKVQADRIAAASNLAQMTSALVVLKGAGSVVADPSGRWWINPTGGPALATAGTGDVLAGIIGALLAQGFPVDVATRGAVWLHGRAADEWHGDVGMVASDVAPAAAAVWRRLRRSATGRRALSSP
jgi:hydroxyethylthiazole kinase-like uncharacterized protein yjeF